MLFIRDFINKSHAIGPSTRGSEVYNLFDSDKQMLVIAVVDDENRPLGIVDRNTFTLKMAANFGRDLFARRPVSTFMNAFPLIVEADTDAEEMLRSIDSAGLSHLMSGFIVAEHGQFLGVGSGLDIIRASSAVHLKRAEAMGLLVEELARAEQVARASSRAKSEFLAVMSHEIRTPLNGVLGVAALMERELTQEGMRPYVETIISSGQSLLRLLTDALDMSRAEAGQIRFDESPVSLKDIAAALEGLWSPRAQEKGIDLRIQHNEQDVEWVLGDEVRIKQIFNNLIGNALKFTDSGIVAVNIASWRQSNGVFIKATIDDSGPGIAEDALQTVFQAFNTGSADTEGAGAGLGLTICRQFVERLGGAIEASRSPIGGARMEFWIVLPDCAPARPIVTRVPSTLKQHRLLHVLVVDDNSTNRFVATKVLQLFGCTADTAENGAQAVSAVQTGTFDLVLMDVKMPVMDGITATKLIRGLGSQFSEIPIIALTANADPHDAETYIGSGMNCVVEKPLQPDALFEAIRCVTGNIPT